MFKAHKEIKTYREIERTNPPDPLGREVLKLLAALGLLGAGVYFLAYGLNRIPGLVPPPRFVDVKTMNLTSRETCGELPKDGLPVTISMLYSEDKREWMEYAADRFARVCPNIQVKLSGMGTIQGAEAILNGRVAPTLWAPADELVLSYLAHRWKERSSEVLFDIDAQLSIAISPLVVLMWEDRLRVIEETAARGGIDEGPWMATMCALVPRDPGPEEIAIEDMVPGRWIDWYGPLVQQPKPRPGPAARRPAKPKPTYQQAFPTLEEIQRWGRVKIGHASPRRSAAGLQALYLMAYDYVLPPGERVAPEGQDEDSAGNARSVEGGGWIMGGEPFREAFADAFAARKDALQRWLTRCEAGLEAPPENSGALTDMMFHVGTARYDGIVTHEQLVFEVLERIDDHEGAMRNVRLLYPQPTLVNQHPVVFLWPEDPFRAPLLDAAQRWVGFLRSQEMQLKAIEYGFRPANPEVSIEAFDEPTNPFLHLQRYGVSTEVVIEEPPRVDGEIVGELIKIWEDASGRN